MAVFTIINANDLAKLLKNYNIGKVINFQGILEGVENTNYKITTENDIYILTIFEKRVNEKDLPFFIELQNYLTKKKIKCPKPICDKNNKFINKIKNRSCVIMSFLNGTNKINNIKQDHCYKVGELIANIHSKTKNFKLKRLNSLDLKEIKLILKKCEKINNKLYMGIINDIKKELIFLNKNWPQNIPKGIIHADVFIDNIFFKDKSISGIIDFYFSCYDFYAYELSICINAWCFNKRGFFDKKKYLSIMNGYESIRKLSKKEIASMPILLRGATIRILVTRLHDLLFHKPETFVTPKNPMEYFEILEFHRNNDLINEKY